MPSTRPSGRQEALDPDLVNAGILAMLIAAREDALSSDDKTRKKTEVILAEIGFSIGDVARLTGREYQAVRSILRRSRPDSAPSGPDAP